MNEPVNETVNETATGPAGGLPVETLPVEQLQPAPYNPRIPLVPGSPAWQRLERSLEEFQLVQPFVWNRRTGHLVSGHQRLEILRARGVTEVPAVVVDLPLDREQALNITLNNRHVGSDWDAGKLLDVLTELQELPDFDATLTGFDDDELRGMLLEPEPAGELDGDEDDEPDDAVHIVLSVPAEQWDAVRPDFDRFLATHRLTPHISLPQAD